MAARTLPPLLTWTCGGKWWSGYPPTEGKPQELGTVGGETSGSRNFPLTFC